MSKTKQIIEIEVTWSGWKKLSLNWLIQKLMEAGLEVERFSIKEKKK